MYVWTDSHLYVRVSIAACHIAAQYVGALSVIILVCFHILAVLGTFSIRILIRWR